MIEGMPWRELFLLSFSLGCCATGGIIFYLIYKNRMRQENNKVSEKTVNEETLTTKKKPNKYTQNYFNNLIEFQISDEGKYIVGVTEEGNNVLRAQATAEEAVSFTTGLIAGYYPEFGHRINGHPTTSFESAESFRWLMRHCINRIQKLLAEERLESAEQEHKKDCETYDKVKEILEEEPKGHEQLEDHMKRALIVVDAQYDFMPGGSLAVPEGDKIVPFINSLEDYDLYVFTQDYHPKDHCSFKENGGPWPLHCVKDTKGSEIHKDLNIGCCAVIKKGLDPKVDSYSAFWDNHKAHKTELDDYLKEQGITDVDVVGLALNVCVAATAKDAVEAGYKTRVLLEGCKGIEINEGDIDKSIKEMKEKGVVIV